MPLPTSLVGSLRHHLEAVRRQHSEDLATEGGGHVPPHALARQSPNTPREWIWQYVAPSARLATRPKAGITHRHHLHEAGFQKRLKAVGQAVGTSKWVNSPRKEASRDPREPNGGRCYDSCVEHRARRPCARQPVPF